MVARTGVFDGSPPRIQRRPKVAENVARTIIHEIVAHDLSPGARLPPEADMLRRYQVSRSSLREALRILEVQGIISIRIGHGGGPVVNEVGSLTVGSALSMHFHMARTTFRQLFEARVLFESMIAGHAATQQNPNSMAKLQLALASWRADLVDDEKYVSECMEFHSIIACSTGNPAIDLCVGSLKSIFDQQLTDLTPPQHRRKATIEEHAAIARAILDGNAERARSLMFAHMNASAASIGDRNGALLDEVIGWRSSGVLNHRRE